MEIHTMPGHWIRRLNQMSTQIFLRQAKAAGVDLTPVQFAALDAIRSHPDIDQAGVASEIAYDRATIGGVIDRLVRKGLVHRRPNPVDRRAYVLALTDDGARCFDAFLPVVQAMQTEILGQLSAQDRALFMRLARLATKEPPPQG